MNTETIKANHVASLDDVKNPGDFAWSSDFKMMFMLLPGESLPAAGVRVIRSSEDSQADRPRWVWDGNVEAPTLTPSLYLPGVWHGYLTDGVFKSC